MTGDLFDHRAVPLHVQIEAAQRELRMRQHVYPRRIASGAMTQALADVEIANMRAIVETLLAYREMVQIAGNMPGAGEPEGGDGQR